MSHTLHTLRHIRCIRCIRCIHSIHYGRLDGPCPTSAGASHTLHTLHTSHLARRLQVRFELLCRPGLLLLRSPPSDTLHTLPHPGLLLLPHDRHRPRVTSHVFPATHCNHLPLIHSSSCARSRQRTRLLPPAHPAHPLETAPSLRPASASSLALISYSRVFLAPSHLLLHSQRLLLMRRPFLPNITQRLLLMRCPFLPTITQRTNPNKGYISLPANAWSRGAQARYPFLGTLATPPSPLACTLATPPSPLACTLATPPSPLACTLTTPPSPLVCTAYYSSLATWHLGPVARARRFRYLLLSAL